MIATIPKPKPEAGGLSLTWSSESVQTVIDVTPAAAAEFWILVQVDRRHSLAALARLTRL